MYPLVLIISSVFSSIVRSSRLSKFFGTEILHFQSFLSASSLISMRSMSYLLQKQILINENFIKTKDLSYGGSWELLSSLRNNHWWLSICETKAKLSMEKVLLFYSHYVSSVLTLWFSPWSYSDQTTKWKSPLPWIKWWISLSLNVVRNMWDNASKKKMTHYFYLVYLYKI